MTSGRPIFILPLGLVFVFVEGEEGVGERERFRKLAGYPQNVRFMECGSCNEVVRRLAAIKAIAREAETGIHAGGVVDRDFRPDSEADELGRTLGIFVLPVHEVENFFLHPMTLRVLLEQNGRSDIMPLNLIRSASDARAGNWVFQHTMATPNAKALPGIGPRGKEVAKAISYAQLERDSEAMIQTIVDASGYGQDNQATLKAILEISVKAYGRKRQQDYCTRGRLLRATCVDVPAIGATGWTPTLGGGSRSRTGAAADRAPAVRSR